MTKNIVKTIPVTVLLAALFLGGCRNHTSSGNGSADRVAGEDVKGRIIPEDSLPANDSAFPVHQ